ncbi:MAG: HD domain-containing protein [Candidatus Marinimicrobia bacterium]|jgi:putative nucleotidyltransferase with HDIG domain|nr:HD domain-containing protein [Candidatus Neomarinimicrobiota bacterium]MBT4173925.1 HD domain-containing protein [Candidatus Neomarinimicrobiota bacterium]MBT7884622.1 HD domain-containing protein [Candidatus Neomarinimicrobiota bacterium]
MDKIKNGIFKHFESIIILVVIAALIFINWIVPYKLGFLNFFYLPIILAGYLKGQRQAVLSAVLCILAVIIYIIGYPEAFFTHETDELYIFASLTAWGSFLILTSAAIGYLHEQNNNKVDELKTAYQGILEILSKYLESADEYTQGHSVRVAHLANDISKQMGLPSFERENIRTAALLHDIGKAEVSMELVQKAAFLTTDETSQEGGQNETGARILSLVSIILKDAVPIVLDYHKFFYSDQDTTISKTDPPPIGVSIVAVADAYDTMVSDRPYRSGMQSWKAFAELEKDAGKRFNAKVVEAFKVVLVSNQKYT